MRISVEAGSLNRRRILQPGPIILLWGDPGSGEATAIGNIYPMGYMFPIAVASPEPGSPHSRMIGPGCKMRLRFRLPASTEMRTSPPPPLGVMSLGFKPH